jgi:type II restriction enzyme
MLMSSCFFYFIFSSTSFILILKLTLIMPFSKSGGLLPIFLEAKSMTDEVNPNKRQKEEAQKVDNVRRKWQDKSERLNFILLLGGTVPRRYLEVEAGSGLDWIWEHRVNDLNRLLDWYKSV